MRFLSFAFGLCAFAVPTPSAPVEVAVGERAEVDLGDLWVGESREIEVRLTNPSDSAHPVRHVTTSCGCTGVTPAPTEVPAGGSVEFTVTFTAPETIGPRSSRVMVIGLPPEAQTTEIAVSAQIRAALVAFPEFVDFGDLSLVGMSSREATVELRNLTDAPVTVSGALSSSEWLSVSGVEWPLTLAAGDSVPVSLVFRAGEEIGLVSDTLQLELDHGHQSRLDILGRADVRGLVTVEPARLWYGFLDQGDSATLSLRLSAPSAPDFQITDSTTAQAGISTESREAGDGVWQVDVTLDTADLAEGFVESTLIMHTDLEAQPQVTVDLLGAIRAP